MHSLRVVKMVSRSLGSPSKTGRNSICVLCINSMDSLHPAIQVGVRELRIVGFDKPPRYPECVTWSEEWLIMSQGGGELSEINMIAFVPISFLFVNGRIFTSTPLRILCFVECLQLPPGDSCCCLWNWQMWCRRV